MPRISIKDYNASFFHIMVQGIRKEYIFCDEEDKNKYLKLMYENLDKYEVKIIAYCIMGNHAHMLIYIENKNEMSKFMKSVNIGYARYYNKKYKKVGYVFRNRYKLEPIYNEKYLISCIHYIHDNPIKANLCNERENYKFSSYIEYIRNEGKIISKSKNRFKSVNALFISEIDKKEYKDYKFMDYENNNEFVNKEIIIKEFLTENSIKINEIKGNRECLKELSKKLKEQAGLTHQEIADEIGVSRIKITRIINEK